MIKEEILSLKVDVPEGQIGQWRVEKYVKTQEDYDKQVKGKKPNWCRYFGPPGNYTRLLYGKELVMYDEWLELSSFVDFCNEAHGDVLVTGLGLGVVIDILMLNPDVKSVTAIEISDEVIELTGGHYKDKYPGKITLINADAWKWEPEREYDCAWHDVWNFAPDREGMKTIAEKYSQWVTGKQTGWPEHTEDWKRYCNGTKSNST